MSSNEQHPGKGASTAEVMARLLAHKKAAGSHTPKHSELGGAAKIRPGGQFTAKPQRPGGNRGRG